MPRNLEGQGGQQVSAELVSVTRGKYTLNRDQEGRLVSIYKRVSVPSDVQGITRFQNKVIWHITSNNGKLSRRASLILQDLGFHDPEAELLPPPVITPKPVPDMRGIDVRKKVIIPMVNVLTNKTEFDVIVYGVEMHDLLETPNKIINSISNRHSCHYPDTLRMRPAYGY
jgi:hypothetical protein